MSEFISRHPNLKKVFFHELGHYIAEELNEKHFGTAPTKLISFQTNIQGEENHHLIQYSGKQVSEDENNFNWEPPYNSIDSVPYKIASILYGCIFQYLYNFSSEVENCYRGNGENDAARITHCSIIFFQGQKRVDKLKAIYSLAQEHAKVLSSTKLRDIILEWDLKRLLNQKNEIYHLEVDLSNLSLVSTEIIEIIEKKYLVFVDDLRNVITNS
ncbi:hypothetical protein [Mesoflavibacter zeaxanthinifaciens]|jgi:hypothetical protein|uniref:hypothetical protein n=1 Tax=Mesoflavibacter zeaxanthinifaciens TaxID=393060 RepID=UPI003A9001C3